MERPPTWLAPAAILFGATIGAIEFSSSRGNNARMTVLLFSFGVGILIVGLLHLLIVIVKRTRQRQNSYQQEKNNPNLLGTSAAIGGALAGSLLLFVSWTTDVSKELIVCALGGGLSGFMISLGVAVLIKVIFANGSSYDD
jgi:H+/Cl- antiporter ClcA